MSHTDDTDRPFVTTTEEVVRAFILWITFFEALGAQSLTQLRSFIITLSFEHNKDGDINFYNSIKKATHTEE